ncbi:phosphotransferase, partial [Candidatus Sumerlaeota bacterium]|nr:phosphotransferase [Candidatus Sumerlaeota bacterium]
MSWKIFVNQLPESVLQAVLRIHKGVEENGEWRLLRLGNNRRIYRYQPSGDQAAWIVKWEWSRRPAHYFKSLRGKISAVDEQVATQTAIDAGLPAAACRFASATRFYRWPLHTLLVFECLEARPLRDVLFEARHDGAALRRLLQAVAQLSAQIHRTGLLHGDFSSTNILAEARGRLHIIDWKGLRRIEHGTIRDFRKDPACLLEDLMELGLARDEQKIFLGEYVRWGATLLSYRYPAFDGCHDFCRAKIPPAWV